MGELLVKEIAYAARSSSGSASSGHGFVDFAQPVVSKPLPRRQRAGSAGGLDRPTNQLWAADELAHVEES